MSRIIESQLRIYGSVIIAPGVTATAPAGYDFIKLQSAHSSSALTFTHLAAATGTNFINTTSGTVLGVTGVAASSSNLNITPLNGYIIGRWYEFRPSTGCTTLAYIGK